MPTSDPLHVAFVWHMHQPYYRSARTGIFSMPWARMHALKDYLDMVETLADYPDLHQTFNLVPSLVEQLEQYASGEFVDTYWEHTLRPAAELRPEERAYVLERMCERPDHPRARSHPRYLELAQKREAHSARSWEECAAAFTVDELRDLQVWFNLAWFDPRALAAEPLAGLVSRGRDFHEQDKQVLADVQAGILARTLPAYRDAAARGQLELSTSPYFHPILPLLINSDSARISAPATMLPPRRFSHPEDAAEQIHAALKKHEQAFGDRARGMWCSEQAVGEDVVSLLIEAGLEWTISDETVLARSISGAAPRRGGPERQAPEPGPPGVLTAPRSSGSGSPHIPYRLQRETGEMAIIFRDHTLSDLIGFAYQSWASRDAAADLIRRLRDIRSSLPSTPRPLVTVALDGENAWEYYPNDGRDFLQYLYEGLSADPALECVSVSEHLRECRPTRSLEWLHTGSWIGGDLHTWSGDRAHNIAWDLLHDARDLAACRATARNAGARASDERSDDPAPSRASRDSSPDDLPPEEAAWRHVLVAEGSDWFWWFGEHHRTELDHAWDLDFRVRLQEVYRALGESVPTGLYLPILEPALAARSTPQQGPIAPVVDGLMTSPAEWQSAGFLVAGVPSTMQRSEETEIEKIRFGWHRDRLCLLVVPKMPALLEGLEVDVHVTTSGLEGDRVVRLTLEEEGRVGVSCEWCAFPAVSPAEIPDVPIVEAVWGDVLEVSLLLGPPQMPATAPTGLLVRVGRNGMTEHVFHSAGLASVGWREQ